MNQSINTDSKNIKEPQQKNRLESVNFRHLRASNSKVSRLIRPEIKHVRAFMPVLVTSNFDEDSIKNERATMEKAFSHCKSMGIFQTLKDSSRRSQWSDLAKIQSKKISNDQELIQSDPISCPQNQKGK